MRQSPSRVHTQRKPRHSGREEYRALRISAALVLQKNPHSREGTTYTDAPFLFSHLHGHVCFPQTNSTHPSRNSLWPRLGCGRDWEGCVLAQSFGSPNIDVLYV